MTRTEQIVRLLRPFSFITFNFDEIISHLFVLIHFFIIFIFKFNFLLLILSTFIEIIHVNSFFNFITYF